VPPSYAPPTLRLAGVVSRHSRLRQSGVPEMPAARKDTRYPGKLLQSYLLEGSLSDLSNHPVASGGSGDVYERSSNCSRVRVKILRVYSEETLETNTVIFFPIRTVDETNRRSTARP